MNRTITIVFRWHSHITKIGEHQQQLKKNKANLLAMEMAKDAA
jgi:hypothetical protein